MDRKDIHPVRIKSLISLLIILICNFLFFIYRHHHPLSDGRCEVRLVAVTKNPDQTKNDEKEKVLPVGPGTMKSTPVFSSKRINVSKEPCYISKELFQRLKDTKNLFILNNSTEIDDEFLKGKEELIFINNALGKTMIAPKNIKDTINENIIASTYIPNAMSDVENSIKDIGRGVVENDLNEYGNSQENEKKSYQGGENEVTKPKSDIKQQRKIINIMNIIRQNKKSKTDELDSVSVETKNELNKYLEFGTKSKKILDIIKMIKQNKKFKAVESNDKPNININIFKMMKATPDINKNDFGMKIKHSKTNKNKTKHPNSESIEKKIETDNNEYNSGKAKSTETEKNKKRILVTSESVEKNIEYNNDKYNPHYTNNNKYMNQTKVDESKNKVKPNKKSKTNKIKLLETNVRSESESIENKNKESKKEQKKKIKYHESDSTEKVSAETANDAFNVINENYKELSESDDLTNPKISEHEKKNSDDNSDDSDEIQINNVQYHKTTLRPKKKKRKDYSYMQGPHTLGENYISYEVKYKSRGDETSATAQKHFTNQNNAHNIKNTRRINGDTKNYYNVPFRILARKLYKNVTNS